jgi:hypothetical protein
MTTSDLDASGNVILPCGYSVYHISQLASKWKCPFCSFVIKNPYQLKECGHRVCADCYDTRAAKTMDQMMICPVDGCNVEFDRNEVDARCIHMRVS